MVKLGGLKGRKKSEGTIVPAHGGFSAARGAKFAIFLGDEGAILVHLKDKTVISRQFVPDMSDAHLQVFKDALAVDPRAPVYLILDTMDQAFVQQTLPPVSSLSVGKLIKRRLDRDFGANDIKGSLLIGRDKTGRKDWNFLMVAIERTPILAVWLNFIAELPHRFAGILLLSVETERLMKHFEHALDLPREGAEPQWKFFISHNKVGGFRQVILRGGRIIFTRMTQPIGESTPEVIAGNIEQETASTIEYMKRLGFVPQAGLDVYVITSNAVRTVLDLSRLGGRIVHVMTPFEAAQALGISGATQQGDQFGDVVLAACVAGDKSHVLLLSTPQFKSVNSLYQLRQSQRVFAGVALAGALCYSAMLSYDFYSSYSTSSSFVDQRNLEQNNLNILKADIERSGLDVEKISAIIDLYKTIKEQRVSPVPFIAKMSGITRLPVNIKAIEWALDTDTKAVRVAMPAAGLAATSAAPANPSGLKMVATLTLEFKDPGRNTDLLTMQAQRVLEFFQTSFPHHKVEYTKSVVAASKENDSVDINFDKKDEKKTEEAAPVSKMIEAQLVVRGDVITAASVIAVPSLIKPTGAPAPVLAPTVMPLPAPTPSE